MTINIKQTSSELQNLSIFVSHSGFDPHLYFFSSSVLSIKLARIFTPENRLTFEEHVRSRHRLSLWHLTSNKIEEIHLDQSHHLLRHECRND